MRGIGVAKRIAVSLTVLALLVSGSARPALAQYGRTEGGFTGSALGAVGGSALGASLVAGAGIANPLLGGALVATTALGGGFLGGRLGSAVGNEVDHRFTPRQVWSVVGAVTGGLMGFVLPGGGVLGKVVGAALGAAVGGFLGDKLAEKANEDYNPRTVGALIGGVNGALLAGPFGAAVGIPLGYIGGDAFDKHVFVDPNSRLADWYRRDGEPRGSSTGGAEDFDPGPPPADLDRTIYDSQGFDREGYDWTGYNRDGFDREGYDRRGYDRRGRDRQGFDRNGYRVSAPSSGSTSGTAATTGSAGYDPDIYREYWANWNRNGGSYPELGDEHWRHFPQQQQQYYRERYEQRYQRHVSLNVEAYFPPGTSLAEKRRAYREAIEEVRRMAMDSRTPADVREAALQKLRQLEEALRRDLGGR